MRTLAEYRERIEQGGAATYTAEFVRELLDAWEQDAAQAAGEYTLTRAAELSGKGRAWFRHRCEGWATKGLARQLDNGTWLVKDAVIPRRRALPSGGFDPALGPSEIARQLLKAS